MLYHFLSNAIKVNLEGGEVRVSLRPESGHRFRLAVRDRGLGVAPSDVARLFHEFEQIEPTTRTLGPQAALGLALTTRFVELQGGWVGVDSFSSAKAASSARCFRADRS